MSALLVERGIPGNPQVEAPELLPPVTERLLCAAGIRRGMHVLDLGCGTGDVSLLAAKLVGPNGLVLGVDQEPEALEAGRRRAWQAGLNQVYFLEAATDELGDEGPFDAVIGRDVLQRVEDPVAMVRGAARLLRSGGVVAFHESSSDVLRILQKAGLTAPELFGEQAGAGSPQFCAWARKP